MRLAVAAAWDIGAVVPIVGAVNLCLRPSWGRGGVWLTHVAAVALVATGNPILVAVGIPVAAVAWICTAIRLDERATYLVAISPLSYITAYPLFAHTSQGSAGKSNPPKPRSGGGSTGSQDASSWGSTSSQQSQSSLA